MLTLDELQELTEGWAGDRNLLFGSTPKAQMRKLREEANELRDAIAKNDITEQIDAIGDCCVVLCIQAAQLQFSFLDAMRSVFEVRTMWILQNSEHNAIQMDNLDRAINALDQAIDANDRESIQYRVGFCAILLGLMADQMRETLSECWEHAWHQIKDRKGKMVNGVFVKEGDF